MASQSGKSELTAEELHETFKRLHEISKKTKGVYISNGFLRQCEKSEGLKALLDKDETAFFAESVSEYEKSIRLRSDANKEQTKTILDLEATSKSLEEQKNESDQLRIEANEARQEAERLAAHLEIDKEKLTKDLERQKSYELIADRQKWLFTVLRKTAWPAWALVFCLLVSTTILSYFDKETQAFVTILSIAVGTVLTMYATGFTSMFAPMIKDQKPKTDSEKLADAMKSLNSIKDGVDFK